MKIAYPSAEFNDAVAAVCHGVASDEQVRSLNELLRNSAHARDEYILMLELHSRLASDRDLFVASESEHPAVAAPSIVPRQAELPSRVPGRARRRAALWGLAIAAAVALLATGAWFSSLVHRTPAVATSRAVALLGEAAGVQWTHPGANPGVGAPLEPGWLRLDSGLVQVVFYSGARVVVEGPAEFQIVSASQAFCRRGKISAEVPPQARGFRIDTPQGKVTDLGTAFGLDVYDGRTELHVFKGEVTLQTASARNDGNLQEGSGAVIESSVAPRRIVASRAAFASLFDMQTRSLAAEALRLHEWRMAGERLNRESSLLVRFDFDDTRPSRWQLRNVSKQNTVTGDATVVGCRWGEGRWPGKNALEFQGVSDRVRLNVPGEFDALTLAAWVRVQGLDRKLNSLFMCDGFAAGSVHWLVRNDGALGVTIAGERAGIYQIVSTPPVLTLDRFGMWVHLAVVIDGRAGRVTQYVNGQAVGEGALRIKPPFRVGTAELGNWNPKGFTGSDPLMIRNFSGAMDEFCLFGRPLDAGEIRALSAEGRSDADAVASRD